LHLIHSHNVIVIFTMNCFCCEQTKTWFILTTYLIIKMLPSSQTDTEVDDYFFPFLVSKRIETEIE
jgi:hypothetical protein